MATFKKGDAVETIHGQKTKVLDIEERDAKTKKGAVVQEGETWYLLEQPNVNCWFPEAKLKGKK